MLTIDAHHHFWRHGESHQTWRGPEHDALARNFLPGELRPGLTEAGVDRTVLIQSVNTAEENRRLLAYAAAEDIVAGVVAWLPIEEPATAGPMLEQLRSDPAVRGVRSLVGRDSLDWLLSPDVLALMADLADAGLAWDVVPVTAEQVGAVLALAERVPELRIVIDHLARPPVDTGAWQPWAELVARLAAGPGIAMKVSVGIDALTAWSNWAPGDLQRYVGYVVEVFGPERLMLASNWPVIELRCDYVQAWTDLEAAVRSAGCGPSELADVRGGTATRWYGLPPYDGVPVGAEKEGTAP